MDMIKVPHASALQGTLPLIFQKSYLKLAAGPAEYSTPHLALFKYMVWYGMVWYGMAWRGVV